MKTEFVVIDETGNVSYSIKDKRDAEPETFSTFRMAEKRAKELAAGSPGETMGNHPCLPNGGSIGSFIKRSQAVPDFSALKANSVMM